MKLNFIMLLVLFALMGCAKKEGSGAPMPAPSGSKVAEAVNRTLAYEHQITIDTDETNITAVFNASLAACQLAAADFCVVLESRTTGGRYPSAALKFRAKPAGIQKLIGALSQQGHVVSQSTTAEDLGGPIGDNEKKVALLSDYRTKLELLRGRASNEIDALIKVNKELAQVQSDLEALQGTHSNLKRRVDTELLSVSIQSIQRRAFFTPLSDAARDFGPNLSQGIATTITGIAYLIPWTLVIFLIVWIVRKIWSRRQRAGK